jgi:hypothetical protein
LALNHVGEDHWAVSSRAATLLLCSLFVDCTAHQGAAFLNLAIVYAALVSQLEWNCGVTSLFGLDLVETRGFLK